ncbi:hypothetical protein CJJ23_04805 [Mycoplasmopsis agassizii]|uniref:Lipoprotein n=1 Tax=Mycoplasmopsis agassizii TaxID=33922 RepID=A0A269TI89_9BACT|nr:hypothetical protein [Mycoplasmopsis agassizii]PAK20900.1 hypothetical protein CJJ23_04805 [Mycoplasmopsis agassizii]
MKRKFILFSIISLSLGFLITAVACSTEIPNKPEPVKPAQINQPITSRPIRKPKLVDPIKKNHFVEVPVPWTEKEYPEPTIFPKIEKGAAIFEKSTQDDQPYLQISTWNYKWFTFSDFYWVFENHLNENWYLDKSKIFYDEKEKKWSYARDKSSNNSNGSKNFAGRFLIKEYWRYGDSMQKIINNNYGFYWSENIVRTFSEQKPSPDHLKSISLVKNEKDLKTSLRLNQEDQSKYLNYFKILLEDPNKTPPSDEELLREFTPWSDTFNFTTIKSKLDFANYDYLFAKDLYSLNTRTINYEIADLNGGVNINSYNIDPENKTLKINLGFDFEKQTCYGICASTYEYRYEWNRLNSMFIPIKKNSIDSFDMNQWNLDLEFLYPQKKDSLELHK